MFNIVNVVKDWFKTDVEVSSKLSEAKVSCNQDLQITVDKKEYSIVGDAIYTKSSKDVPQWMADLVDDVVKGAWENSTDLNTFLSNLRDTLDQIEVKNNAYDSRITVVETATGNLVQSYETLNSTVQGNQAEIINIQQTYATEDYAVTTAVDQIQASINDGAIGSEILRIDTAVATERDTRSASITAIESQLEDPDTGLLATASATESLYTSVGYEYGTNTPTGIGMLQDVQILQKQNDGVIETTTGTYDVMIGVEDPNNVTDNDELDVTKEPYATWIAVDTANGDIAQRSMHVGDVYIKYSSVDTGYKTYERAYKFIKTLVDGTTPYSTDSEGFTWALITDTDAQNAYVVALNAYDLADGKVTTYYGTKVETTGEATGDLLIASDENDKMYRWNGSGWVDIQDKAIVANAGAITTLNANLQNGDGTWANADSALENTLNTKITNDVTAVESKFLYSSTIAIGDVVYNSGFGLESNIQASEDGTLINPYSSVFKVDNATIRTYDVDGNYSELDSGDLKFYKAGEADAYKYLRFTQSGTVANGELVTLTAFNKIPSIIVSTADLVVYNKDYANQSQTLKTYPDEIQVLSNGNVSFRPTAKLVVSGATTVASTNWSYSTSTDIITTTATTPANTNKITVSFTLNSTLETSTSGTWYARSSSSQIQTWNGSAWINQGSPTVTTHNDFTADNVTVTTGLIAGNVYSYRVVVTFTNTGATFTSSNITYDYFTRSVTNSVEVYQSLYTNTNTSLYLQNPAINSGEELISGTFDIDVKLVEASYSGQSSADYSSFEFKVFPQYPVQTNTHMQIYKASTVVNNPYSLVQNVYKHITINVPITSTDADLIEGGKYLQANTYVYAQHGYITMQVKNRVWTFNLRKPAAVSSTATNSLSNSLSVFELSTEEVLATGYVNYIAIQ